MSRTLNPTEFDEIQKKYSKAYNHQKEFFSWAEEAYGFYVGGDLQWRKEDLEKLRQERRAAFSINLAKAKVDTIVGYLINNLYDIKYAPVEQSDQVIADVFNQLSKVTLSNLHFNHVQKEWFKQGLICGLYYLALSINYDNDIIHGELEISLEEPWNIYPDPYSIRYDQGDAEFLFRSTWIPRTKAKQLWPYARFDTMVRQFFPEDEKDMIRSTKKYVEVDYSLPFYDRAEDRVRIDEYWYKLWETEKLYVDTRNKQVIDASRLTAEKRKALENNPDVKIRIKRVPKIRVKTICGNIELADEPTPFTKGLLTKRFPFIPFYAYRVRFKDSEYIFGLIRNLQDPIREKNKRRTQLIDIVSYGPYAGVAYEEGTFTPRTERMLDEKGFAPGAKLEVRRGRWGRWQVINPPAFPQGLLMMEEASLKDINLISIPEMPSTKVEAGIALLTKERQVLTNVADVFDNFKLSLNVFGKCLIGALQQIYDYPTMIRVIAPNGAVQFVPINTPEFAKDETGVIQIGKEGPVIEKILNDIAIGKFDVIVTETQASPTYRLMVADMLWKIIQSVGLVPGLMKMLLYYIDIPEDVRNEIERSLAQTAQEQEVKGIMKNIR